MELEIEMERWMRWKGVCVGSKECDKYSGVKLYLRNSSKVLYVP